MFFEISLYLSLAIFALGVVYKASGWFRHGFVDGAHHASPGFRFNKALRGIVASVCSLKFFTLLKVSLLEVLFQTRTMKEDRFRWVMHLLIFGGFTVLLLMHALGSIVTIHLFSEYYPSINPFLFIRDLMGILVLAGLIMAAYRRIVLKKKYVKTRAVDYYALGILGLILISGFLLEGTKITSRAAYVQMIEDYSSTDDEQELTALESFWVEDFALVSPEVSPPFQKEILTLGKEVHEGNCAGCHSSPQWAFAGYTVAKLTGPFAITLDRVKSSAALWYIHILASFFGLAYLPFSKMFHIIASPLSLLINAVMVPERSHPASILTRQILEMDACTHCGTCSFRCSTAIASKTVGNVNILPSERMIAIKGLAAGNRLTEVDVRAIQEGIYLCTNCDRCTVVCPVGIDLRELWFNVREFLIQKGYPEPLALSPYSFYRGLNRNKISSEDYSGPLESARAAISGKYEIRKDKVFDLTDGNAEYREALSQSSIEKSFSYCFACENCTTVCPVVGNYENPQETLGLLPHQIMRSVGLGIKDLALGSMMLWDCVTCYQCQEHCPQGVHVTDILYELKNQAVKNTPVPTTSSIPATTVAGSTKGAS
jgi:heterodisulfide reductase subunit C/nitrate reductase gamma subunit